MNSCWKASSVWLLMCLLVPATLHAQNETPAVDPQPASDAKPATDAQIAAEAQADADKESVPAPLSVAPLDHVVYPDERPAWLDNQPLLDGDTHRIVVVSGPSDSEQESLDDLRLMQRAAMATYIANLVDSPGDFDFYPLSDSQIDATLVTRRYQGTLTQGDARQFEHAVELTFDETQRGAILAAWKNVEVRNRLGALGVLVSCGFVLLSCSSAVVGIFSRRVQRRQQASLSLTQQSH